MSDAEPVYSEEPARTRWLSRIAFGGALAVVIARAMLPFFLRDTTPLAPLGPEDPMPAAPAGPSVALVLDVLAMTCALLVLLRVALARDWRLLRTWSILPMFLLALLAFASTAWASDQFAAAVTASIWLAAAAVAFVFAQTVRSWSRLRIVAGVAAGLFLANVALGVLYRTIDLPDTIEMFEKTRNEQLLAQNLEPGSFPARSFENRLRQGQTGGFAASPNSYGATLVMLGFVLVGVAWQRWRDRSEPAWAGILALALLPGAWILWLTGSRTAMAAALLAAAALAIGWHFRDLLARRRTAAFAGVVAAGLLGAAAVVTTGLLTGTLPHDSLAFRWNYWVGAAGVFEERPWLGVGFANFGDAYVTHRLPVAAEEVKDPHNLFVRFFTETGIIGGVLAILWIIVLARELTRPAGRPDDQARYVLSRPMGLAAVAGIIAIGMVLHVLAAIDFGADGYFVFLELIRKALYGLLILAGVVLGAIRSTTEPAADTSPAPALAAAMTAGLAAALVHAMVDVVIFEPPVLAGFAMLFGAAVGIRAPEVARGSPAASRWTTWPLAAGAGLALAAFVVMFAAPVVLAEREVARADRQLRTGAADEQPYVRAAERSPVPNGDYYRRAAIAAAFAGETRERAEALLKHAIAANPRSVPDRVSLARLYVEHFDPPRLDEAAAMFEEILALNPNDVPLRLRYGTILEALGQPGRAAAEFERALALNDLLNPEEPERLSPQQVEAVRFRIQRLRGAPALPGF